MNFKNNKGFGLLEVVVATAIISISLYALTAVSQIAFRVISENVIEAQAEFLSEEGIEVARSMRDLSWSTHLATTAAQAVFYPEFNVISSEWYLSPTSTGAIDGIFERTLIVENVYRDSTSQDIVPATSTGAVLDPKTKLITSQVDWGGGASLEIKTYITDLFGN